MSSVMEASELVRGAKGRKVSFRHILHAENSIADWLGRVAARCQETLKNVECLFPSLRETDVALLMLDLGEVAHLTTPIESSLVVSK